LFEVRCEICVVTLICSVVVVLYSVAPTGLVVVVLHGSVGERAVRLKRFNNCVCFVARGKAAGRRTVGGSAAESGRSRDT
jgi:hypothetical protein